MEAKDKIFIAYQTAAKIVSQYGDVYLPIFERLHKEMEKIKSASDLKTLAIKVAQE